MAGFVRTVKENSSGNAVARPGDLATAATDYVR
jgi:hypothetical protein